MEKTFKVMNLIISTDTNSGVEELIALLTEIKDFKTDVGVTLQTFNSEGIYYVFLSNSNTAKYLLNNPQENKVLDTSMFIPNVLYMDNKPHDAFYHMELLMRPVDFE